jgi:hypothetical protein
LFVAAINCERQVPLCFALGAGEHDDVGEVIPASLVPVVTAAATAELCGSGSVAAGGAVGSVWTGGGVGSEAAGGAVGKPEDGS